ncbi:ABC transporter permease [Thermobifida halotolerans]|uniref:ABC transporter permease n=1 Tax=Thermobifida halotolerans TaxID=483545 RepID=A0AA97M509_9ACTN|nr:ABC transporter permease [Thermobifida halotolerans]UOE20663.1 ABC transporter permease [Thermobifida halotolerans]
MPTTAKAAAPFPSSGGGGPVRAAVPVARTGLLLVAVSIAVFTATDVLPGDAASVRATPGATQEQVAELRAQLGLDRPAWRRYADWAGGLLTGDAGTSLVNGRPVADAVAQRGAATTALVGGALLVAAPLMLLLGWWAGAARRTRGVVTAVLTGAAAIPTAVVASGLAALLSGALGLLPAVSLLAPGVSPLRSPELLVLPVLSAALPTALFGAGLLSGAVADTLRRPHVADARRRGRPAWAVACVDVLPFLLAPFARVVAISAGGLIAATTVVETLFGYPGLGSLLVSAVAARDVPVVQAIAMLAALVVLAGLLAADLVAAAVSPRRTGPLGEAR